MTTDIINIVVKHKYDVWWKDKDLSGSNTIYLIAQQLFLMQTYLYVSMYWRVALILPLIFCRDEESIKERVSRERCVKICDVTFAAGLTIQFIMQMAVTDLLTDLWIRIFYTLTTIFLAVVLALSFRKLRIEQQRIFEGLLSD